MSKLLRARAVSFLAIAHACLYLLSVTLVLVVESPTVAGQGPWDCHHVPVAMDLPDPQGFIAAPLPALCTEGIGGGGVSNSNLPDGVYIKAGTPLRIDTEAHTTGTWYQYAFDWWTWICY